MRRPPGMTKILHGLTALLSLAAGGSWTSRAAAPSCSPPPCWSPPTP
ncbi:hypothetical protein [Lentzea tibetensis]|nr:hypothetical protein [Lentzea tibetensis]